MFMMEQVKCPVCNSAEFANIVTRADKLQIVRCKQCSLAYVNPRPVKEMIYKMYSQDYYKGQPGKQVGYSSYQSSSLAVRATAPYCWKFLTEKISVKNKRTLDIGCAFGSLTYWMQRAGARATGIDLSADGVDWGRKVLKLDLRRSSIEEMEEPAKSFDIITMVDLIEHVADLKSFMQKADYLLKPGGLVFVQTPNFSCYPTFGDRCSFLAISLEHLLYFEPDTLDALFNRYNMVPKWKTVCLKTIPCDIDEYMAQQRGQPNLLKRIIRRMPGINYINYFRLRLITGRYHYNIDETGKEGAAIFALYQKPY